MKAPNHIAGGIVFTGLMAAFVDVNIFDSAWKVPVIIFFALLPDIDLPQTIIGRLFYPISKWINRHYGHRTITHSALFLGAIYLLTSVLAYSFELKDFVFLSVMACFSHLLFDMMTLQGVPLSYPFSKIAFVLPSNPKYRLSSQNTRAEIIVFCFFIVSGIGLQPLLKNGFWNTYNTHFGTVKHLQSEFLKNKELVAVQINYRTGSESKKYQGYCLQTEPLICINRSGFFQAQPFDIIEKVIPKRTKFKYTYKTTKATGIEADSMNSLLKGHIVKAKIRGTDKEYSFEYQKGRVVCELQRDPIELFIPDTYYETKAKIKQLRSHAQATMQQNRLLQENREVLKNKAKKGNDIERQEAFEALKVLAKTSKIDTSQIAHLEAKKQILYQKAHYEFKNQPSCNYQATITKFIPEDHTLFYALDSIFDNWSEQRIGQHSQ